MASPSETPAAPISTLPAGRCLLFVYGTLQPHMAPPATMTDQGADEVRGQLYDLGPYPAAIDIGSASATFEGHVLEINDQELAGLDEYEGAAAGLYRRVRTTTLRGATVWIYEYVQPLPATAVGPLRRWPRHS